MHRKIQIELPILLPEVPDEHDNCVHRLIALLKERSGIEQVHVRQKDHGRPADLCIHYEPDVISLRRVQEISRQCGATVTERYLHLDQKVDGIRSQRHAVKLGAYFKKHTGILDAVAQLPDFLRIEYDREQISTEEVVALVRKAGLKERQTDRSSEPDHPHRSERTELAFALLCGAFLLTGFALDRLQVGPHWLHLGLFALAYLFGGYFTLIATFKTLWKGGFDIDLLMLVAAAGAGILGAWAEGALLLFLFSLGHALEHLAMDRARKSISALADLAPRMALVRRQGKTREIPVEELQVDDIVLVKPNSKISADGIVVKGSGAVNQAPITGESVPVEKEPFPSDQRIPSDESKLPDRHKVFAGTINGNSVLEVRVRRRSDDTTLARLIQLVREAETQKSPTQRFSDRFEKYFVPSVLFVVVLLCFAFLVIDEPFSRSFYRAMSVLVAASPCALAISTPSAVLSGIARAARDGVLIKGGRPLEDLGNIKAMAFDKTGTLTKGKPVLTHTWPIDATLEKDLFEVTYAVEQLSDHPLAEAIVDGLQSKIGSYEGPEASELQALPGRGIRASLAGKTIFAGNLELHRETGNGELPSELVAKVNELEADGHTTMVIRRERQYLGLVAVMDTARPEAAGVLARLQEIGIKRTIMLTGDNQRVANAIAAEIGISDPRGSLLPEDKVKAIHELKEAEQRVAMVGDGVNDAPAMAKSTVGIAMGAAGSAVALETADIALMADSLQALPFAIGLSRRAKKTIRQNVFISLGMVAVLVPLTISGIAEIGPAVALHEGSTLVVVLNALRLLGYKGDRS